MAISHSKPVLGRGDLTVLHVLILVGFGLIGVGAVLPWVDKELPVKVYVLGEQMGIERIWVRRLLVLASVGVLVDIGRFVMADWRSLLELVLVGISLVIAAITVAKSPLFGRWTPGLGVYLTLCGSLLVVFGSSITLLARHLDGNSGTVWSNRD